MIEKAWYQKAGWLVLLRPLSLLYGFISRRRRALLTEQAVTMDVPVVVVGNISVGGTGKTPLLIYLVTLAKSLGFNPGVVSRGYGGQATSYPMQVSNQTSPEVVGDEPQMIFEKTGVPVVVDPNRVSACQHLIDQHPVDIIFSDDGLQHYQMGRQFEIAVIDSVRGLGNQQLMPEGPLREELSRLDEVDLVVLNGEGSYSYPGALTYRLRPTAFRHLASGEQKALQIDELGSKTVYALAGIGNPSRFFDTLMGLGLELKTIPLRDHAPITKELLDQYRSLPLVMTDKDAVKCHSIAPDNCWALSVEAEFAPKEAENLAQLLKRVVNPNGE
ncbi:Tetraacyldisaccharide 4'-kinase [Marinobacterium sp. xm-d-420]|uniref:tetraacyldisaccharide 4'-kinase n=1 Tax=Marinobacterium sp. xm-d-420 TaxID=2497737 RepID=UPI001568603D|nr:tetraacyldisaccharide 4'-kinase [Marinobacterium sp. xm-d-420]NRP27656.1 Tetraacyldisaccharide 4'-kinase [Marinobacterium sp. xm-d-420]